MLRRENAALLAILYLTVQEGEGEREREKNNTGRGANNRRWTVRYSSGDRCTERERENIEIWEVTLSIRLAGHQCSSGFTSQKGK